MLQYIQFPYRLVTYADLGLVALITVVLAALHRIGEAARVQVLLLAAIAAISFGQAIAQNVERVLPRQPRRRLRLDGQPPPTWYAPPQFADASAPLLEPSLEPGFPSPVEEPAAESYSAAYPPARRARPDQHPDRHLLRRRRGRAPGRPQPGGDDGRPPARLERAARGHGQSRSGDRGVVGRWLTFFTIALCIVLLAVA